MGDRRNIELRYGDSYEPVYLYTHWDGTDLPLVLANALDSPEGRGRWDDPSYLARIIFSHMTKDADPETGYGIAPYVVDENWPNIIVDLEGKTVDGVSYETYIKYNKEKYLGETS